MVTENLQTVSTKICEACARVGRDPSEITLIAVSKTKPNEMIAEAIAAGQVDFGENKVQEILKKKPEFPQNIRWHMIGHLQTNKVRQIIPQAALIHSVDSMHLAQAIDREAGKLGIQVPILIEVNVANEESKYGIRLDETSAFVEQAANLPNIRVEGLMTIAPFVENAEDNREIFSKLYQEYLDIQAKNIDNVHMNVLSMGMTNDYEVAVEEGATMVRVGTGIFGVRDYR